MIFQHKNISILLFVLVPAYLCAAHWPSTIIPSSSFSLSSSTHKKYRHISSSLLKKRQHSYLADCLCDYKAVVNEWSALTNTTSALLSAMQTTPLRKKIIPVRVLLASADADMQITWRLVSPEGFFIYAADQPSKKIKVLHELVIVVKNGVPYLNGKVAKGTICISPVCGHAHCNTVSYDGDFFITQHKNSTLCINSVDIEEYVFSVLHTESWPGWPLEVNKVFAIASRSYVISKMLEAQKNKRPYHVKNTNVHQTYTGRHDSKVLKQATEQTRGIVLGFQEIPILAMFDCCCGGIIPAHIDDFNFKKVPYLARDYACTYCKKCSLYSWEIAYDQLMFESLIRGQGEKLTRLIDVRVTKKDKAGLVSEVKVKGPHNQTLISGKKLYSLLKEVKSFYFTINKKGKKIVFNGRGFGHHLGLCQWGAREMVRQGIDYVSILQFYYPGTHFMKLV